MDINLVIPLFRTSLFLLKGEMLDGIVVDLLFMMLLIWDMLGMLIVYYRCHWIADGIS